MVAKTFFVRRLSPFFLAVQVSAALRSAPSPERSARSASKRVPAWLTSPWPSAATFKLGRHLARFTAMLGRPWLDFTFKVTLLVWGVDSAKPIFPYQAGTLVDPTCWRAPGDE